MDHDEEPEPGSSSQTQNLHDLQNYLVTFNKDADDVLPNMDVDPSVGDVGDLYGATSENSLQESGDAGVSAQFSSGFYSEQGILDTALSDEPAHQMQSLVGSSEAEGDHTVMNDLKQEVGTIDLEGVSAQIAGFGDSHLTHSIPGLQTGSLSQGLIMTPLGDSIMTDHGKVLRIVSLGDEGGQFLSLADGQQMQIINSEDLGLTTDALDPGDGSLDITSDNTVIRSNNTDSPIPLASLSASTTSGIAMAPVQSSGDGTNLITSTAAGASLLSTGLEQLVALQGVGDGTQSQLVSLQGDALHPDALQVPVLAGGEGMNTDMGYQTITIMPSELSQHGEMNYLLILSQPETENKEAGASVAQFYDLKQENQDYSEEMIDESADSKQRLLRFVPKKMVTQLGNQQLMCAFCNYTSPKRYLLTRHMRSHSDERPFKCDSCDRGFKTSASLLNHVNTHTGTRPHKCKTCEAAFTTSGELVRHIRYRHTFEKPHRCPECDYASVELSKLKRHMRSHTGERPYKCPNCPYASPDTYKLKRHMRIHTGEKPYECDHCHARFTQSNSLKAHKLIHTGNKPVYQCSLCPTTCGRKTDLKIHINKLHSAGLSLECRKCGKTFQDRYSYKLHLRSHDIDKCYKCEHCNFIASSEKSLETHALAHCGKFRCDECNTTFSSQKQYEKHESLQHPNGQVARRLAQNEKILSYDDDDDADDDDFDGNIILKEGNNSQGVLAASLDNAGQDEGRGDGGTSQDSGGSQVIITPLASDTLHKNLIQDIKEGKLGDVPQVVIVHPDGSQEEISSKLASNRWNVGGELSQLSTSEASTRVEHTLVANKAPVTSMTLPGDSMATVSAGTLFAIDGKDDGALGNVNSHEHCEAATQVEIESDGESNCDLTSLDESTRGRQDREECPQQVTKVSQENVGSLFGLDASMKGTLAVSDLTQALKTSTTTSSPLYIKTLVSKPGGKKSIAPAVISQAQSFSSFLKPVETNSSTSFISMSGPRTQQYSLLSSNTNYSANSGHKMSSHSPLNNEKSSESKVYVSLSGSEPPLQLLSGDVTLVVPEGNDQGVSVPVLGLGDSHSSALGLTHGHDTDVGEDSYSQGSTNPMGTIPSNQRTECNLSTSPSDSIQECTSNLLDQSAIRNLISQKLGPTTSEDSSVDPSHTEKEQNQLPVLEMDPPSSTQECHSFDHEAQSPLEQAASSLPCQTSALHHTESDSEQISHSPSKLCDESAEQSVFRGKSPPTDLNVLERNICDSLCDSDNNLVQWDSNLDASKQPALLNQVILLQNVDGNMCEIKSVSESSAASTPVKDSIEFKPISERHIVTSINDDVDDANSAPLEQTLSKSAKGKSSKRKSETDQALVMTGKRLRKALVKVSM